jgi:hypothetical protein
MAPGVKRLRALGARVARAQDAWLSAHSEAASAARQRLLAVDAPFFAPHRRPRLRAWGAVGGLAAAAAIGAMALWPTVSPALAFDVQAKAVGAAPGPSATRGTVGDWIAAPPRTALSLRFSDGSLIELDADARARVAEVTSRGARVVLERGTAHALVIHQEHTAWDVKAGPFDVRVVGTKFEVGWDPERELFTLSLEQGKVAVAGCAMAHEREVATGETMRVTCRDGRPGSDGPAPPMGSSSSVAGASPPAPVSEAGEPSRLPRSTSPVIDATERAALRATTRSPAFPLPPETPATTWQGLVAEGRYGDAIAAAEIEGLSDVCLHADIAALTQLGDAARFAGRADAAGVILRRLRERFPYDERASVAAFHLGRMAFDRSAYDEARGWFEVYLSEQPAGPLSREASGRLIEAIDRAGDPVRARQAARRYLEDFPGGPHAQFARSLLAR